MILWQRGAQFFRGELSDSLYGPRVLLTMPKTFDDVLKMSVICFAQDNLESNFTPRYE